MLVISAVSDSANKLNLIKELFVKSAPILVKPKVGSTTTG